MPPTPPGSRDGESSSLHSRAPTREWQWTSGATFPSSGSGKCDRHDMVPAHENDGVPGGATIRASVGRGSTMATLEVLSPKGQDFLELEGERLTVGRSDANDLPLKDDSSLS